MAPQQTFIIEMDDTMVPTVRSDPNQCAQHNGKSVQWQEAKVSLAHVQGGQGSDLLDFHHACDYLSAAAHAIEAQPAAQQDGLQKQKGRLKTLSLSLLNELQASPEPSQTPVEDAPVRRCYRYLNQRQDQLDHEGAISQGLSIGSGEMESAHHCLIQKRLKLPGAWWPAANAETCSRYAA